MVAENDWQKKDKDKKDKDKSKVITATNIYLLPNQVNVSRLTLFPKEVMTIHRK